MRRVDRQSVPVPQILSSDSARASYEDLVAQIDLLRLDPRRRPSINSTLFDNAEVYEALRELFRGKCAYCESNISTIALDHFRPIRAATDSSERRSSLLHYSWLAYEWRNIYLVCRECISSKRNRFPVSGARAPLLFGFDEVQNRESPLLLDPCFDSPEASLTFTLSGHVSGKNARGRQTINILDLNRDDLVREREVTFASAVERIRRDGARAAETVFDPDTPYVGAFENFARKSCALLAQFLGVPTPSPANRLSEFVRMLGLVSEDDAVELLRRPPESPLRAYSDIPDTLASAPYRDVSPKRRFDQRIARVEIENFKSIDLLSFEVQSTGPHGDSASALMLLADNAAGKTTALQAIALALMGPDRASQLVLDRSSLIRNGSTDRWGQIQKAPARAKVTFQSGEASEIILNPFSLEFSGTGQWGDGLMAYGAHRLLDERKRRGSSATARVASLFNSRATIPHPDYWLASTKQFDPVARALADVLVLQEDDRLMRDEDGGVFVQTFGQPTPIDVLSDGYRSVLAIAVDSMRWLLADWGDLETARGIVLIDEVDAHLHPRWKLQIMTALRTAMPQVQFIVTTHDPLCLRGMGRGEVIVMKRSQEQRFDLVTDLPDFSVMSAEQILMSDYFGLNSTSDPAADIALGRLADAYADEPPSEPMTEVFDALMIGASPERQVAETAMLQYLRERRSAAGEEVSEGRRAAINAALLAIRASGHLP